MPEAKNISRMKSSNKLHIVNISVCQSILAHKIQNNLKQLILVHYIPYLVFILALEGSEYST